MYKYAYMERTSVEKKHQQRTNNVNRVRNLLHKGKTTSEISEIMRMSIKSVLSLMTDIDEEALREELWAK